MSTFDDDERRRENLGGWLRTDGSTWGGEYLGYTLRGDTATEAVTPTEGFVGRYDHASDITTDGRGVPVGKGNWLMTFFRKE